MPQIDVKQIEKLMEKTEELKKIASELYEKVKDSELRKEIEKLAEIKDTLTNFMLGNASEFGLYLHAPLGEEIEILVRRLSFEHIIRVPRDASIIDVYKRFFDDQTALEKLVSKLVEAMVRVAEAVERNVDILRRLNELEGSIGLLFNELEAIHKKLEDP